jgi:hypothetical protein
VYRDLVREEKIRMLLDQCDRDLADEVRRQGCPSCSGVLHRANYARKPRGVGEDASPALRWSFCCGREGCRKRATPGSVRFLGRRVYDALVFLVAGWASGPGTGLSVSAVLELTGISRRTLQRWRRWWRCVFVETPLWRAVRGRLDRPIGPADLPRALLDRFSGEAGDRVVGVLRLLAPLSTSLVAVPAF